MNNPALLSQKLDGIADRFDQLWQQGFSPDLALFIDDSDVEPAERRPLLYELIPIDMEYRWRQAAPSSTNQDNSPPKLRDYLARWPELDQSQLPPSVIAEEFRIRHRWGDAPDKHIYQEQFGNRDDVAAALVEIERELSADKLLRGTTPVGPAAQHNTINNGQSDDLRQLQRYRLLHKIGEGGMGEVFLMEDTQLNRRVALKKPRHRIDAQAARRLLVEARAAAAINHPNVCPVFDVGETPNGPYITMAYIEGETLADRLAHREPLAVAEIRPLFSKLVDALREAHACGVLHRDLKPANIMIDRRGEPILMDFGLALYQAPGDARITQPGDRFGSPAYMAPEQLSGSAAEIGTHTDIYGLGAILYESLAGHVPFQGNLQQTISQVLHDDPPPLSTSRQDIPPDLERLCLRMLAKSPQARPSLAEAARALAALDEPLVPTSKMPVAQRLLLNPWLLGLAASIVLLLGWLSFGSVSSQPAPNDTGPAGEANSSDKARDNSHQVASPLAAGQVWVGSHQHGFGTAQAFLSIDRVRDQQVEATMHFALDRNLDGIACSGRLIGDRLLWNSPSVTYDGRIKNGRLVGKLTGSGHSGAFDFRLQSQPVVLDFAGSIWEGTEKRGLDRQLDFLLEVRTQHGPRLTGTITLSDKYGRATQQFSGRMLGDYLLLVAEKEARYAAQITGKTMEGSTYDSGHGGTFQARRTSSDNK